MNIFQYWDSELPPPEVLRWVDGFKTINSAMTHTLFSRESATTFVRRHFSEREAAAFRACAPPAMQADYLRLCLMSAVGGVYMDADKIAVAPLDTLCAKAGEGFLPQWLTIVTNGVLFFRNPHNAFIDQCLEVATANIIHRRFESVIHSGGPGLYNAVWAAIDPAAGEAIEATLPQSWREQGWSRLREYASSGLDSIRRQAVKSGFSAITRLATDDLLQWVSMPVADYKAGDRHWVNWKGSIYL